LARLKITDLKQSTKVNWFDTKGNVLTAYDLSVTSSQDGDWHMQVDATEHVVPNCGFDIHGVHMDRIDTRPRP
jgi:hypothetical protein